MEWSSYDPFLLPRPDRNHPCVLDQVLEFDWYRGCYRKWKHMVRFVKVAVMKISAVTSFFFIAIAVQNLNTNLHLKWNYHMVCFFSISDTTVCAFYLNPIRKKNCIMYSLWIVRV